jgi:hypothetical protein
MSSIKKIKFVYFKNYYSITFQLSVVVTINIKVNSVIT